MKKEPSLQPETLAPTTALYYAALPDRTAKTPLAFQKRWEEVNACAHERVKREKYFIWKLLEYALQKEFPTVERFSFQKSDNGKWGCKECFFSLSHSKDALAVAISPRPVGVDIQKLCRPKTNGVLQKITSDEEQKTYFALETEEEQAEFFTRIWTEKESLFKRLDLPAFFPEVPFLEGETVTDEVEIRETKYLVTVATDSPAALRIYRIEL